MEDSSRGFTTLEIEGPAAGDDDALSSTFFGSAGHQQGNSSSSTTTTTTGTSLFGGGGSYIVVAVAVADLWNKLVQSASSMRSATIPTTISSDTNSPASMIFFANCYEYS